MIHNNHRFPLVPSNSVLLPGMADLVMTACLTSLSVDMLLSILKYRLVDGKVGVVSSDLSLLSLVGIHNFLFFMFS